MKKTTTGTLRKFTWSKKKTAITSVSLVLALAMVVGLMPHTALRSYAAGAGVLTSVSGTNNIPDTYDAVNVSADSIKTYSQITDDDNNGLVAFDFHIFANEFASNAHTCGNVAVKDFGGSVLGESGAPEIGSREEHDPASVKMSYVQNPLNWTLVHNDLVLGDGNTLTGDGQVTLTAKNGKTYLFGNNNGGFLDNKYIDDESDSKPLINIQMELNEAEQYQQYLVDLMNGVKNKTTGLVENKKDQNGKSDGSVRVLSNNDLFTGPAFGPGAFGMGFGPGGKVIDLKKYPEDTIIIDFHKNSMWSFFGSYDYNEALNYLSGSVELKGTTGKRVIINIDTAGFPDMKFFDTHMKADKLTNEENSVHSDNNILWNFYDSSRNDGTSSKSKIEVGGTWMGTILAPDADVYCRAGLNGSIIANRVATTAETHKSDYTGEKTQGDKTNITVKKNWVNDNADSRPTFITVKLYQNDKLYETVQMTADGATGNTWTHEFKNLPKTDKAGKVYKYKVVEEPVAGYTGTVYNYTITNTSEGGTPKVDYFGSVTLKKTDGSNNLAGARFKLTSDDGNNLSSVVVNNAESYNATDNEIVFTTGTSQITIGAQKDGKATLPYGRYTLTEVSAPAGYKLDSTPVRFTLSGDNDGATMALNDIVNQPVSAKFIKLESQNHMALAGATLELTPNWGQSLSGVTVTGASGTPTVASDKITFTSGTSEITFNKIPAGSYTITEITAPQTPDKYDIAAPITFNVDDNGNVTIDGQYKSRVEMVDEKTPEKIVPEYGSISFVKNFVGTPTVGDTFTFTLTNIAGKKIDGTEPIPGSTNNETYNAASVTGATGTPSASGLTFTFTVTADNITDGKATITINNLITGAYSLSENGKPGYKTVAAQGCTVKNNETAEVSMTNEQIKIYISKKDATSGAELSGATLKLYDSNNTEYASWTSDGTPHPITGIPAGTYTLKETAAPKGYVLPDPVPTSTFTVNADGSLSGANTEGSTVTMYNTPTVVKIIKKTTDGKVLAGAKLELSVISYVDSSSNLNNVTGLIETTLNEAGNTLTWTSATVAQELRGLPAGQYKLEETAAPSGYKTADPVIFKISASGEITINDAAATSIVLTDEKIVYKPVDIGKIDIKQYYDDDANKDVDVYLPGAKLAIFKADEKDFSEENAVRIINTTTDKQQTMLTPGKYVLVELKAPTQGPSTTTTGSGDSAVEHLVKEDGEIVYVDKEYDKTNQHIYFDVDSNGKVTIDGLDEFNEDAGTTYGDPSSLSSQQFTYSNPCYYALTTTDIFATYESFPSRAEFELPSGYTCSSFKIMREGVEDPETHIKSSVEVFKKDNPTGSTDSQTGKTSYSIPITSTNEEYDPTATYLAILELSNHEEANIPINFVYTIEGEGGAQTQTITGSGASEGGTEAFNDGVVCFPLTKKEIPKKVTITLTGSNLDEANIDAFRVGVAASSTAFPSEEKTKRVWDNSGNYTDIPYTEYTIGDIPNSFWQDDNYQSSFDSYHGNFYTFWDKNGTKYNASAGETSIEIVLEDGKNGTDPFPVRNANRTAGSDLEYFILYTNITGNSGKIENILISVEYEGGGYDDTKAGVSSLNATDIKVEAPTGGAKNYLIKLPDKQTDTEKPYPCSLELTKVKAVESGTAPTLPNAKYALIDSNGEYVNLVQKVQDGNVVPGEYEFSRAAVSTNSVNYYDDTNEAFVPLVTNSSGKITVTGLKPDTYTMREVEAPAGYELPKDPDTEFKLTNADTVKKTAENTAETGSLEFIKYDDSREPKAGAVFQLYRMKLDGTEFGNSGSNVQRVYQIYNSDTEEYRVAYETAIIKETADTYSTDTEPTLATNEEVVTEEVVTIKTDQTGKIKLDGLDLGYLYYAVEVTPAPGTEIPVGLQPKVNGVKTDKYSKPLPRLSVTKKLIRDVEINGKTVEEGTIIDDTTAIANNLIEDTEYKEIHDSFYNIFGNVTENYANETIANDKDKVLHYGIILADESNEDAAGKLFVLNTNKTQF